MTLLNKPSHHSKPVAPKTKGPTMTSVIVAAIVPKRCFMFGYDSDALGRVAVVVRQQTTLVKIFGNV